MREPVDTLLTTWRRSCLSSSFIAHQVLGILKKFQPHICWPASVFWRLRQKKVRGPAFPIARLENALENT